MIAPDPKLSKKPGKLTAKHQNQANKATSNTQQKPNQKPQAVPSIFTSQLRWPGGWQTFTLLVAIDRQRATLGCFHRPRREIFLKKGALHETARNQPTNQTNEQTRKKNNRQRIILTQKMFIFFLNGSSADAKSRACKAPELEERARPTSQAAGRWSFKKESH